MITLRTLSFAADDSEWRGLHSLFVRCDLRKLADAGRSSIGVYSVTLEEGSLQLRQLEDGLRALGLTWGFNRQNKYTDKELASSEFVELIVRRMPKGDGGPQHGTQYDLTAACPRCGTGAPQVSALVLDESQLPKAGPIFETLNGERIVSTRLRDAIEAVEPVGLELREVLGRRSDAGLGLYQLIPSHHLPPMHTSTEGVLREDPCPVCMRDGFFADLEQPMVIRYGQLSSDEDRQDAYSTYECFGNSVLRDPFEDSGFAQPLLIMSQRLRDVFVRERVPRIEFEPVQMNIA